MSHPTLDAYKIVLYRQDDGAWVAEVPALSGWRRELFGEKALALKHGKLALSIERGHVVANEHGSS